MAPNVTWGYPKVFPLPPDASSNDDLCEASASAAPFRIAIFVFAWRRVTSLQRTLASLLAAEYCGGRLSLTILFDSLPDKAAMAVAESVRWPHGPFRIVVESSANGLRNMWVHVMSRELEREPPEAHVLPIEDDIEVSPLFHWWLCRAADAYGPFDSAEGARRHGKLAGVSLYSPRYDEIHRPGRSWRPRWPSAAGPKPAYLFQLPCSWGALYFRAYWRRFVNFYQVRTRAPFYNFSHERSAGRVTILGDPALAIPECDSSIWGGSWKRFMIDYMYGRGDVMLYPSAPIDSFVREASVSFSTHYKELGAHQGETLRPWGEMRPNRKLDLRTTVPLLQRKHAILALVGLRQLPSFDKLPVVSLHHHKVRSLAKLEALGHEFVESRPAYSAEWQRVRLGLSRYNLNITLDPRRAVQHRASRAPSAAEYAELAHIWL